jgi:hypothetical protein
MSTRDRDAYGTVLSYAVHGQDNEIVLTDYGGFVFAVKGNFDHLVLASFVHEFMIKSHFFFLLGQKVVTDLTSHNGQWDFICAEWFSEGGRWTVWKNGVAAARGQGLAEGELVVGGGSLVLGQEQDVVGGRFAPAEAFTGVMARAEMWSQANLNGSVVARLATDCEGAAVIKGDIFTWTDVRSSLAGRVQVKSLNFLIQYVKHIPVLITVLLSANNFLS